MNRNQRPDIQLSGHFHTHNYLFIDGTHFLACPGFQDETEFFKRLGFGRSIGWHVCEYKISKGKLRSFSPKLYMIE